MEEDVPEIQILGIEFSDGYDALEVAYIERRNIAPQAYKREVITIQVDLLSDKEAFQTMISDLSDWIDEAHHHMRDQGGTVV